MFFSSFWTIVSTYRHFQLATTTVFHTESEFAIENSQFLQPDEKIEVDFSVENREKYEKIALYSPINPYSSL